MRIRVCISCGFVGLACYCQGKDNTPPRFAAINTAQGGNAPANNGLRYLSGNARPPAAATADYAPAEKATAQ